MSQPARGFGFRPLRFIPQLLKSLWLFFPGIMFLLFPVFSFWSLGQGKDIIVAFIDNNPSKNSFQINYTRSIFFLGVGFWVYISWYSSRIISYIKMKRQEDNVDGATGSNEPPGISYQLNNSYDISQRFLDVFPRLIGNACFLIVELAVLQLPVLTSPVTPVEAWIILIVALDLIYYINNRISNGPSARPSFRKVFWILLATVVTLIIAISFIRVIDILVLFFLLLLFHVAFIYYINLRRVKMDKDAVAALMKAKGQNKPTPLEKTMDYFCIPRKEKGYFRWSLIISLAGIIFYLLAINWLYFARSIGPFPFIILAFAVLLAFGNIITAFSVRLGINFHFMLLILAFILGFGETHYVRVIQSKHDNGYADRPILSTYLRAWLHDRKVIADSSSNGYNIYFVMADGGASRSAYWTAAVLGKIEDASLARRPLDRFSDHVFCLSGTSGGGVGVATFFSMLRDKEQHVVPRYSNSAKAYLRQDYFTYTLARMLGPDFFNYIFNVSVVDDRAAALEKSFEESSQEYDTSLYQVPFYDTLYKFPALKNGKVNMPLLCINTTRMQDGNPGVVTNLLLDPKIFNNRVDVLGLLGNGADISITSGSVLGARFPYLSPAGRIGDNYFVDGGYFDNSGAGMVQEMIRGIINIAKFDSMHYGRQSQLYQLVRKLHFKVLHITNSPVIPDSSNIRSESPFKNDLLSPVLTILGAYDMQTTVNDLRLITYIKDINSYENNRADYVQIPLYEDATEWEQDPLSKTFSTEPSYAMNWFMSDTTVRRINNRLQNNPELNNLINGMYK